MAYHLSGKIYGFICRECRWPLWGVVLRVYSAVEDERIGERIAARPKYEAASVDEQEVETRSGRLLAEATVDKDGGFDLAFDPKADYRGGPVEIELRMEGLARIDERTCKMPPRQVHLTTLQPDWTDRQGDRVAVWDHFLPAGRWCRFLCWYDIWAICGRVTICDTDEPLRGATVEARDVDWVQQDYLGAAVTDSDGRFVIYYAGSDFRRGTWTDIELIGGPDVYFTIKAPDGAVLLEEPPERGREPDRENVDNCFCVHDLCVPRGETKPQDGLAAFTHVGHYIYALDIDSLSGQSGLTKASSPNSGDVRAFHGTMRLRGQMPKTVNNQPLEYCFEWREVDSAGTEISPWTQVTQGQIARTVIGTHTHYDPADPLNPWPTKDYTVNGTDGPGEMVADFTADGWVKVPQENDPYTGNFQSNGTFIALRSNLLVPWGSFNKAGLLAGSSAAPVGENRFFGLRMLARSGGAMQVPAGGTLAQIAINNKGYDNLVHHPSWNVKNDPSGTIAVNLLDIEELIAEGCDEIQDELHVLVTAAHPNLGSVSLSLEGGNAASFPNPFTPPSAGLPEQRFGTATNNFDMADLIPCAYIVELSTTLLMTNGDEGPAALLDRIAFCKAPEPSPPTP